VEQHLFAYLFFLRIFYPFCLDTYLSFVICTFLIYLSVDGMDGNNEQILASSILLTIGHGIWYVKVCDICGVMWLLISLYVCCG